MVTRPAKKLAPLATRNLHPITTDRARAPRPTPLATALRHEAKPAHHSPAKRCTAGTEHLAHQLPGAKP